MFNKIKGFITGLRETVRISKKIKGIQKMIDLREASLRRHGKGSIAEYNKSGLPKLEMQIEMLKKVKANLFKAKREFTTLSTGGIKVQLTTDVEKPVAKKKRKTRSDKGKKRGSRTKKK